MVSINSIIVNIMADKVIEPITYIKSVSKKKVTIDRIHAHLCKSTDVDEVWSMENLVKILDDMSPRTMPNSDIC